MGTSSTVRIGARGSNLSRRQVEMVRAALLEARPELTVEVELFTTQGDRQLETPLPLMGGKGVFTMEIEAALREGQIDLAVHSLKDLPVANPDGIVIGATPPRASVADALVSRSGLGLRDLPEGAVIGTSSHRRAAQLVLARPDLRPRSIRGNVETRLRKGADPDGPYDAVVLAKAGLERLGLLDVVTEELPLDVMLPAPGQAALAVQCRDAAASLALASSIDHQPTHLATLAERAFLNGLGGGCSAPVAAYGELDGDRLTLRGRVIALDGGQAVDVELAAPCSDREAGWDAGQRLAQDAIAQGAADLMAEVVR
jgi:hydroxymethylbilane synthase